MHPLKYISQMLAHSAFGVAWLCQHGAMANNADLAEAASLWSPLFAQLADGSCLTTIVWVLSSA